MRRFSIFLAACAVSGMAAAIEAQERWEIPEYRVFGAPASADDAEAIDALMHQFRDAWYAQDTQAILATHADDIEWINAYARIFRGIEPLRDFLDERLFPAFAAAASRGEVDNMEPISRRYLGTDAAVLHWYTDGERGASRNGDGGARRTHLHFVLEKADGQWLIAHIAIFDARR